MKTKGEIIAETIAYYRTHPRASRTATCAYLLVQDGAKSYCAVGRCMNDEAKQAQLDNLHDGWCFTSVDGFDFSLPVSSDNRVDRLLKEEYQGHSHHFWRSLQTLHDYANNWDGNELSEEGENHVDHMLKKIENDEDYTLEED